MKFENKVSESPERKNQKQRLIEGLHYLRNLETGETQKDKHFWLVQFATALNHVLERGIFFLSEEPYKKLRDYYMHIDLGTDPITPSFIEEAQSLVDEVLLELKKSNFF